MTLESLLEDREWCATVAEMLVMGERAPPAILQQAGPLLAAMQVCGAGNTLCTAVYVR